MKVRIDHGWNHILSTEDSWLLLLLVLLLSTILQTFYDICLSFRLAKIINMDLKIVIFRFKIIDLGAKLAKIINMGLNITLTGLQNSVKFLRLQPHTPTEKRRLHTIFIVCMHGMYSASASLPLEMFFKSVSEFCQFWCLLSVNKQDGCVFTLWKDYRAQQPGSKLPIMRRLAASCLWY